MKLKTLALAIASLPAAAFAADENLLDEIVVTATRTAQTADETLASVTVITRKDIERSQAQSVQDLLRGVAGVSIANSGGMGKATSVYLRGTEAGHVLVLIDGVKAGSATLGTTAFQDIPVEQIERIEIVRGPRSSLYGSEAIGGVVQIFTRRGGGAFKPSFSLGGGSYKTWQGSVGASGGGENGWYSLGLSGLDTEGFNAKDGSEPDRDGYRNLSGRARLGYRLGGGTEMEFNWLRAKAENEYDGTPNEGESIQQVLSGRLRFKPTDIWQATLLVGQGRDESDNFKNGVFYSRFDTIRDSVSLQNDLTLGAGRLLTVGVDYQDDRVDSTTAYAVSSRSNTGVFAQYQTALGAHDLQVSLRHDDNEQFGGHTTGGLAWGYSLADDLRLTASYGTAFKAPTFNSLYWPGSGNPDLRPEKSKSLEVGLAGKAGAGRWSLNAFSTRVDDLIAWACVANCGAPYNDDVWQPGNVNQARIRGLEAVASTRLAGWAVQGALTLQDPENRSAGANRGNALPRRAEQILRIDANRDVGQFLVGATLFAEGRRYDNAPNTVKLAGYAVVDLRAEYRLERDWRLQASVKNLFDKEYETASGYNQPGRGIYFALRYEPK